MEDLTAKRIRVTWRVRPSVNQPIFVGFNAHNNPKKNISDYFYLEFEFYNPIQKSVSCMFCCWLFEAKKKVLLSLLS
jgi:hypothetical protein